VFTASPYFRAAATTSTPYVVLFILIAVSLAVVLLIYFILSSIGNASDTPKTVNQTNADMQIDLTGNITSFSKSAEELLGYSSDEIVGKTPLKALFDPEDIEGVAKAASTVCNKEIQGFEAVLACMAAKNMEREWDIIKKDKTKIKVLLTASQNQNSEGKVEGFFIMIKKAETK
jgi:PAS domain S-box-containing protein